MPGLPLRRISGITLVSVAISLSSWADPCAEKFLGFKQTLITAARKAPRLIAKEAGTFVIYPTAAPFRLMETAIDLSAQSRSLAWLPVEYIRKDGLRIAAVAGVYHQWDSGPTKVARFYFLPGNTVSDFEKQLDDSERKDGITVYVDGIPRTNSLSGFGEATFQRRFSSQPSARYIQVQGLSDMFSQIEQITKTEGKPIARLEILAHGVPGAVNIGENQLSSDSAALFHKLQGKFAKGAEIRFAGCLLGANLGPVKWGEDLLRKIGEESFDQGGSVFASNHVVYIDTPFTPDYDPPLHQKALDEFLSPVEAALIAAIEAGQLLSPGENGNYRRITIPAGGPSEIGE